MKTLSPLLISPLAVAALSAPALADVVYNSQLANPSTAGVAILTDPDENSSWNELPGGPAREFDCRIGDSVTLAGTARYVTGFSVRLGGFFGHNVVATADMELNIYANIGGLPGTLLWTATQTGVVLPTNNTVVDVNFAPNITVPDSLIFTIGFPNVVNPDQRTMGLACYQSVFVGSSGSDLVLQDTATGVWRNQMYGTPFQNVQAKITAVPAPASLIALGAPLLVAGRRRNAR